MSKTKREKSFDAVQWMRDARSRLSKEIEGMSFEEQRRYVRERLAASKEHARRASEAPVTRRG